METTLLGVRNATHMLAEKLCLFGLVGPTRHESRTTGGLPILLKGKEKLELNHGLIGSPDPFMGKLLKVQS